LYIRSINRQPEGVGAYVAARDWVDAVAELIKPYLSGGKLRALARSDCLVFFFSNFWRRHAWTHCLKV